MISLAPRTVAELDDLVTRPSDGVLCALEASQGDIAVLGAGGKMGLHLCLMLKRALKALGAVDRRLLAVSRFEAADKRKEFAGYDLEMISADLSEPEAVNALPQVENVFFLAGIKFGTAEDPALLKRLNEDLPALVAERFAPSRIVALSTGCVYPYVSPETGGCTEDDATGPVGDYAQSCLGRERAFVAAAERLGTRSALIRLNYAVDLRYGVLVDLAQKVLTGEPVDVSTGYLNFIWQGDALAHTIQALGRASAPPYVLNVTGPGVHRVRELAERFGKRFGKPVTFTGEEAPTAWLNNASRAHGLFGPPEVSNDDLLDMVADWVEQGGATLGKPTHFERRDGNF